ncbi:MAG: SWIM zinc finger family protein [Dehalococcoidia bacterium]|nr:SWIM zinc finger family protein [Dehalococcoidia bacterium]
MSLADRRWQRALHRALHREGAACRVGQELWRVRSHEGDRWYDVLVRDDATRCTCDAARHGIPCWHAALAWYLTTFSRSETDRR